jgi:hypothetical protein
MGRGPNAEDVLEIVAWRIHERVARASVLASAHLFAVLDHMLQPHIMRLLHCRTGRL